MTFIQLKPAEAFRIEEQAYVFADRLEDGTLVFVDGKRRPLPIAEKRFVALYAKGDACRLVKGRSPQLPPMHDDDPRLRKAKSRAFYLRLWDQEQTSLSKVALARFIRKHDAKVTLQGYDRISPEALHRAIKKYGKVGDRPVSALVDRPRGKKGGRQDPLVEKAIDAAIDYFYASPSIGYRLAYSYLVALAKKEAHEAGVDVPKLPCEETIRLRIRLAATRSRIASKLSPTVAAARYRGISNGLDTYRALETVIIDGTPVDTWVVVDDATGAPLGRPYLTVAIDAHTRMILAIHIGFTGESLEGIQACILEIMRPKHDLSERFPLVRRGHDGWGMPGQILVDNALRQTGVSLKDALAGLGIDLEFTEIRTPQAKAIGERFFQTLNTKLFHQIAGGVYLKSDLAKALSVDPSKTALVSLDELEHLLHVVVVEDYHYVVHDTLGIQPALAWEQSLARHGRPYVADLREAARLLGTYAEGTVTREGIRFKNNRFHDQIGTTRLLESLVPRQKVRSQRKAVLSSGKALVKIKWDPADASKIEVWNPASDPPGYEVLPNVERRFSTGLSFATVDLVRKHIAAAGDAFVTEEDRIAALDYIRRILDEASPKLERKRRIAAMKIIEPSRPLAHLITGAVADGTPTGNGAVDVESELAEPGRTDGGFSPKGIRKGGKKATKKSIQTRRAGPDRTVAEAHEILDGRSSGKPTTPADEPVVDEAVKTSRLGSGAVADLAAQVSFIDGLDWE